MAMILKNSCHEAFAQHIVEGRTATAAATLAGYSEKSARFQGSHLATNPNIRARIEELKARTSEKTVTTSGITKAWVLSQLRENAVQGVAEGQRAPAIRALELIGKELGMFVDPKEISLGRLKEMSTEDLVRLLTEIDGEAQTTRQLRLSGIAPRPQRRIVTRKPH
jgi:phage terminase small subunit